MTHATTVSPSDFQPDIQYRSSSDSHASFDALWIAAHPDDAELTSGGTIATMIREGKRIGIVDCTRGELGSRGTPDIRRDEAISASKILGIAERWNLGIPDGDVRIEQEYLVRVVMALRYFRPHILLFPPSFDRHIDHEDVHRLVRKAHFASGLRNIRTEFEGKEQEPFRPARMFAYMQTYTIPADVYVDTSTTFDNKIAAMRAFATQFYTGIDHRADEPQTFISRPEFVEFIEARARYFGERIGVKYAEAYQSIEPLGLSSLSLLL
jgi:N-acetylglucosamine malate deacetylase 1